MIGEKRGQTINRPVSRASPDGASLGAIGLDQD